MTVEKFFAYQIEKQFPEIYREEGEEFVQLLKYYYEFMENSTDGPTYQGRRVFEYRDIDTTPTRMLLFFKNKFLSNMPFNGEETRFIIKHILDLYRRRGTPEGIELFFRLFYQEDSSVFYPAINILKPSSSKWEKGIYLELLPVSDIAPFSVVTGARIFGSLSGAETTVVRATFIFRNGSVVPVLLIETPRGNFIPKDVILRKDADGNVIEVGRVYGSIESLDIIAATSRNNSAVGDILDVVSPVGSGGKVFVTEISSDNSGQIFYEVVDGGSLYSIENTALYVSNQTIELVSAPAFMIERERVTDQFGNTGTYIGHSNRFMGFRMDAGDAFISTSVIQTTQRSVNITIPFVMVFPKNDSSPGILRPEALPAEVADSVQVGSLSNTTTVTVFSDVLNNFRNVILNSSNYNLPPALVPMSGAATSPNRNTVLTSAFDPDVLTAGTINNFININPGQNYIHEVFAIAVDTVIGNYNTPNQILELSVSAAAFVVGQTITQGTRVGRIERIDGSFVYVSPYNFQFFDTSDITYQGNTFTVSSVTFDYSINQNTAGNNASITSDTAFGDGGKVTKVSILNSGYGYGSNELVTLEKNGEISTSARVVLGGQGTMEGFWSSFDSQLNSEKVIQDSDYWQEFSYEVSSGLPINTYEDQLKSLVHVAGTKFFGKFVFRDNKESGTSADISITGPGSGVIIVT